LLRFDRFGAQSVDLLSERRCSVAAHGGDRQPGGEILNQARALAHQNRCFSLARSMLQSGSMSDAGGDKKDEKDAPAAGGGNKKIIIAVVAVNVLLAGGLGYVVMNKSAPAEQAKGHKKAADGEEAEEGEDHEGGEEGAEEERGGHAKSKIGPLIEVGSFVSNLQTQPGQPPRYAKVSVAVEAINDEAKTRVEGALVPIKTEALMMLSNAKVDDMVGQEKIMALSEALAKRINKLIGQKTIKRVYFSELVVQ
jgi:flagellar basal body-associated protein FliL